NALALDTPTVTSLTVSESRIVRNQAVGGAGGMAGTGGKGGSGGNADGGGILSSRFSISGQVTLTISDCIIKTNTAVGGEGGEGGNGGVGRGGGLLIDANTTGTVNNSLLSYNVARG